MSQHISYLELFSSSIYYTYRTIPFLPQFILFILQENTASHAFFCRKTLKQAYKYTLIVIKYSFKPEKKLSSIFSPMCNAQFSEMIILAIVLMDWYVITGMIVMQRKNHFPFPINSCLAWWYEYQVKQKIKINHATKNLFWQGNLGVH